MNIEINHHGKIYDFFYVKDNQGKFMETNVIINDDCLNALKEINDNTVDLICTDPPYFLKFMNKSWDSQPVSVEIWKEAFRVLKNGAFAFVMCARRQDVLCKQIQSLTDAGFNMGFSSIYWTYSSGFPKAANMGKKADKVFGVESEVVSTEKFGGTSATLKGKVNREDWYDQGEGGTKTPVYERRRGTSEMGKKLEGSYGGFQPKPAVEVILIAMKPLDKDCKTFVQQAIKNGHGITWLDDCRIPYADAYDEKHQDDIKKGIGTFFGGNGIAMSSEREHVLSSNYEDPRIGKGYKWKSKAEPFGESKTTEIKDGWNNKGRFPANLIVSDDVLNNGKIYKQATRTYKAGTKASMLPGQSQNVYTEDKVVQGSQGSYSRYFDLDQWAKKNNISTETFPFIICPKVSKSEKNKGCENLNNVKQGVGGMYSQSPVCKSCGKTVNGTNDHSKCEDGLYYKKMETENTHNNHPTVKPLKLMTYLIMLGSCEGDLVLDPFAGSGTTCIASKMLKRNFIGIEKEKEYYEIAEVKIEYG